MPPVSGGTGSDRVALPRPTRSPGDLIDNETLARAEEARQIIADCDQRLARYRAALEAGTDPSLISRWTAEVNATRAAAEAQRRGAGRPTGRMSEDEIRNLVDALGSILRVLHDADPADKARIYAELGLRLTYQPGQKQ